MQQLRTDFFYFTQLSEIMEILLSVLFNTAATRHRWLLSTGNDSSVTEHCIFNFSYFQLIYVYI